MDKEKILKQRYLKMKCRCYNKSYSGYDYYGGRGIKVCDEWLENRNSFVQWGVKNGFEPELQIDRINNDGNYEPNNCRWSTRQEQGRNKRKPNMQRFTGSGYHRK